MSDYPELDLRLRYPLINWDEPQKVTVTGGEGTAYFGYLCRYCVALVGVRGADVLAGKTAGIFQVRDECLDHIRSTHQRELG